MRRYVRFVGLSFDVEVVGNVGYGNFVKALSE